MAYLCVIEGLIGAGKSTLTENLSKVLGARPMYEPVKENPYLEDFYEDQERWGLEMQFYLLSHRFKMHKEAVEHVWRKGQTVIQDRSIFGDSAFCKKLYLDGKINRRGYESYLKMREVMVSSLMIPQLTLYLDVTPEKCLDRIHTRGRNCEAKIPLDYLQGLSDIYEDLMSELEVKGSHVIRLDWSKFLSAEDVISICEDKIGKKFERYPALI